MRKTIPRLLTLSVSAGGDHGLIPCHRPRSHRLTDGTAPHEQRLRGIIVHIDVKILLEHFGAL